MRRINAKCFAQTLVSEFECLRLFFPEEYKEIQKRQLPEEVSDPKQTDYVLKGTDDELVIKYMDPCSKASWPAADIDPIKIRKMVVYGLRIHDLSLDKCVSKVLSACGIPNIPEHYKAFQTVFEHIVTRSMLDVSDADLETPDITGFIRILAAINMASQLGTVNLFNQSTEYRVTVSPTNVVQNVLATIEFTAFFYGGFVLPSKYMETIKGWLVARMKQTTKEAMMAYLKGVKE